MNEDARLDDELLELGISPPESCPYLSGRRASLRYAMPFFGAPELFDALLKQGYRRNGRFFYRPACPDGCRECVPLRVAVRDFKMSRSQRRLWNRVRGDTDVAVREPRFEPQHLELFNRHARSVSERSTPLGEGEYRDFLLNSPVSTLLFEYRIGGGLVGVGFLDVGHRSASSIYFFWDPDHREYSPGTLSALEEIRWCRDRGLDHYYLGYWIADCPSMSYKNRFRPYELLDWQTGSWRRCDGE